MTIGPLRVDAPAEIEQAEQLIATNGLPLDGLRDHFDAAVVAREGGRILAVAAVEIYGTDGLLRSVAVDARHRGRGAGVAISRAAMDLARARGVRRLFLLTETAEGFFPRLGFVPVTRDEVPESVRQSVEFTTACPASAAVMVAVMPTAVDRTEVVG